MKRILLLWIVVTAWGCAPQVHFMKVGREAYPPKPETYSVLVYSEDAPPEQEYLVIGVLYVEIKSKIPIRRIATDPKVIEPLRREARKYGADAILGVRIGTDLDLTGIDDGPMGIFASRRAQAKAIVFVKPE